MNTRPTSADSADVLPCPFAHDSCCVDTRRQQIQVHKEAFLANPQTTSADSMNSAFCPQTSADVCRHPQTQQTSKKYSTKSCRMQLRILAGQLPVSSAVLLVEAQRRFCTSETLSFRLVAAKSAMLRSSATCWRGGDRAPSTFDSKRGAPTKHLCPPRRRPESASTGLAFSATISRKVSTWELDHNSSCKVPSHVAAWATLKAATFSSDRCTPSACFSLTSAYKSKT